MFAIEPGDAGPLLPINDCLRDLHERRAEQTRKEIEKRKAAGVPLDDRVDWRADVDRILDEVKGKRDRSEVRVALRSALMIADDAIDEPKPFEPDAAMSDVSVRLKLISKGDLMRCTSALAAASYVGDDAARSFAAAADHQSAMRGLVALAVHEVAGLVTRAGPRPVVAGADGKLAEAELDVLDRNGLIAILFAVAREYQTLGPFDLERFAQPRQSTYPVSTAPNAHPASGSLEGVTVAGAISGGQTGRQTVALGDTSSTTHGSVTPLLSAASSATGPVSSP